MIDTAKIVDLALILIDASVGFEMQTFEYLTLLRVYTYLYIFRVMDFLMLWAY